MCWSFRTTTGDRKQAPSFYTGTQPLTRGWGGCDGGSMEALKQSRDKSNDKHRVEQMYRASLTSLVVLSSSWSTACDRDERTLTPVMLRLRNELPYVTTWKSLVRATLIKVPSNVLGRIVSTQRVDAAYCYRFSTGRGLCVELNPSSWGLAVDSHVGPRNHVLDGIQVFNRKWHSWRGDAAFCQITLDSC